MKLLYDDREVRHIFYRGVTIYSNSFEDITLMKGLPKVDLSRYTFMIIAGLKLFVSYVRGYDSKGETYSYGSPYYCKERYDVEYIISPKDGTLIKATKPIEGVASHLSKMILQRKERYKRGSMEPYSYDGKKFIQEYYKLEGIVNNYVIDGKFMLKENVKGVHDFDKHGYAQIWMGSNGARIIDMDFNMINDVPEVLYTESHSNMYFKDNWCSGKKRGLNDVYWIAHRIPGEMGDDSDEYNYMLSDGTYLCKKWYKRCECFAGGLAPVCKEYVNYDSDDNKWTLVDSYGKEFQGMSFAHVRHSTDMECYIVSRKARGGKLVYNFVDREYADGKRKMRLVFKDFWLTEIPQECRNDWYIVQRADDKRYSFLSKYLGKATDEWFDECRWAYRNYAFVRRANDKKCNICKIRGGMEPLFDEWMDDIDVLKGGMFKCVKNEEVVKVVDTNGRRYTWPDLKYIRSY